MAFIQKRNKNLVLGEDDILWHPTLNLVFPYKRTQI